MPTFQVGQTVYVRWSPHGYEGRRQSELRPMTVTKIGRKWVELDNGRERFDRADPRLQLDGGKYSSPGRVYLSPAVWQQERARQAAWNALCNGVDRMGPPETLTLEAIQTACRALGLIDDRSEAGND